MSLHPPVSQNTGSGASLGSSATPELECTRGTSRPYMFGEPWAIPGYIEAEFYDYGGEGVSGSTVFRVFVGACQREGTLCCEPP